MYKTITLAALFLFATGAHAQVLSSSQTDVLTSSAAGASNGGVGNGNTNNFEASDGIKYSGHYTVHANPGTSNGGASSGFSGDNCGNTGQKSASLLIGSGATMYTIESVPCNLRASARMGYQIADSYDSKGQTDVADNVRSIALLAWCKSLQEVDNDALHNCEDRNLITHGKGGTVKESRPLTYVRTPEVIPTRPAGWTNADQVQKSKTPAARDSGWVEPARNP